MIRRMRLAPSTVLALLVFVVAALAAYGGLLSHAYPGDTSAYSLYGRELVLDGRIPYRDFYDEYPPGAVPVFALPAIIWNAHYVLFFKLWMALCGAGCVVAALAIARRLTLPLWQLAPVVLLPLLLGPVYLNRYDPLPALLLLLAVFAVITGRERTGAIWLGLGTVVKLFPAVVAPLALRRAKNRRAFTAWWAASGLVLFAPFFLLAPGGVGFSLWSQAKRHLQIETLASSILLVGSKLGIHHVDWIAGKPGSIDIGGSLADALASLSSLISVALVLWAIREYWCGPDSDARFVTAAATAVTAFAVFGKVLSPQYLTWVAVIVPLTAGRNGLRATAALLGALILTQPAYIVDKYGLREQNWTVWALLARNALLVVAFVYLVRALREWRVSAERR
ncbi:MAG: DUF2029 domain-containing protein [Actinobacteria bacterium]|uniref:Unannotated protein n=1 Tax=freshwater metagenome TaxID=449393 RepID=A0A6J6QN12_9ZZZZ|nr:DUF2029 domain-containing protein [Actinomycetota bacterium]